MIVPLKIAVWSLKLVKWLPGIQNDSPVMNTQGSLDSLLVNKPGSLDSLLVNKPGRLDSPVMNTRGILDSPVMNTLGSRLLGVIGTSIRTGLQKNLMVINRPGSQDSSMYYSLGSLDSVVYFALASFFKNKLRSTPWWWIHQRISTPW